MQVGGEQSDTFESYVSGAALNNLSGGVGWCKLASYADRTAYLGILTTDDFQSYTGGVNLRTLNGGTGAWATAYEADDVSVVISDLAAVPTAGSTLSIFATASGGFPAYSYQWYKNGVALTNTGNITGALTNTLGISNFQNSDAASYTCNVTDTTSRVVPSQACAASVGTTNAQIWANLVVTNGGRWPSTNTISAFDTWDAAVTTAGIRANLYHVNLIAPDSLVAALTPYIATVGFTYYSGHSSGAGTPSVTTAGINCNGLIYDTGVDCTAIASFTAANMGFSIYCSPGVPTIDNFLIGYISDQAGNRPGLGGGPRSAFNGTCTFANGLETGGIDIIATLGAAGYFIMDSRTASNSHTLYLASSGVAWGSVGTGNTNNTQGPINRTMAFGGYHGESGFHANATRFSFYCVQDGLSSANGQALFNATQALRVSLGGGFA
jgi:hypothetical protein